MTRILGLALLAAIMSSLSIGILGCGSDDDGSDESGDRAGTASLNLVIGDSAPLSGDLADFGPPTQKAADLAIAQINDAIDQAGIDHTVEVVHEDNCGGADQQCAVQAVRKLVQSDNATCLAGVSGSADTIASAESVTIPEEVLLISPASTSDEITELDDDGTVNRTAPPDSYQGPTLAQYVADELGGGEGKTVNIGARNDAYGTGLAGTFGAAWKKLGGSIVKQVVYDVKLPTYDSEAEEITSGDPDAIVIIDYPETYNKVSPALVRTGKFDPAKAFITDGLISGSLAEGAGEEAVSGLRGTSLGTPDDDATTNAFDKAFKAFEPKSVDRMTFDAQNFDSVILCYLAAVAAGSVEGPDMAAQVQAVSSAPGKKFTWQALPEAIEALQNGEDIDYQGVSGAIEINEAGDATAGVYDIYQFKGKELEAVDEVALAKDE